MRRARSIAVGSEKRDNVDILAVCGLGGSLHFSVVTAAGGDANGLPGLVPTRTLHCPTEISQFSARLKPTVVTLSAKILPTRLAFSWIATSTLT